jgi:hypothetical protein
MSKPLTLSQPNALAAAKVERDTGIIRNVAILSRGEAIGHGYEIDDAMLRQAKAELKSRGNVKVHLTHAHAQNGVFTRAPDSLTQFVGRVLSDSARIEGGVLRGDVRINNAAANLPGAGNVRQFILDNAEESPDSFGLSIVYDPDKFLEGDGLPKARIKRLRAVDFVGDPGGNFNGLLSQAEPLESEDAMTKELRAYLHTLGLSKDATDEQALEFVKTLKKGEEIEAAKTLASVEFAKKIADRVTKEKADADAAVLAAAGNGTTLVDADDNAIAQIGKRTTQLQTLATAVKLEGEEASAFVAKHLAADSGIDVAKKDALQIMGNKFKNPEIKTHATVITGGENLNLSTLSEAMSDAIMQRIGRNRLVQTDERGRVLYGEDGNPQTRALHARAQQFRGLSLLQMFRYQLKQFGVPDTDMMGNAEAANLLSRRELRRLYPDAYALAQSTSDFDNVLADTMRKSLRAFYLDAPTTWNIWARRATTPDFKVVSRPVLSESPSLQSRNESGEIKYVTLGDSKETYTLQEYIGGIRLTRQAIVNDDMDVFGRIPQLQANAAARLEDDVAYAIITANAALGATGGALFNATAVTAGGTGHANYTSSGTAISVASLAVGEGQMMVQQGPKLAAYLELRPKFLLVPVSKKSVADQLINSTVDPAKNNSASNPYHQTLTVVPSARLQANSATAWYLFADYRDGQIDTVEVCFLESEPMPVLQVETDFDTDDAKYKVRHSVVGKALDFRGVYKNAGA